MNGEQLDRHLSALFGERKGTACLAFGRRPYRDESGVYRHREWSEVRFAWPADAARLRRDVAAELTSAEAFGDGIDVYVCPHLRAEGATGRRQWGCLDPVALHGDWDSDDPLPAWLTALAPMVVWSGQPGHAHVYVLLDKPMLLDEWDRLQRAFAAKLGAAADPKVADNDLLRLSGTTNHKGEQPSPVVLDDAEPRRHDARDLARVIGVNLAKPRPRGERIGGLPPVTVVPVPEPLPRGVRWAFDEPEPDRSRAHHRLVGACFDDGLSRDQTRAVVASYGPSVNKYGGNRDRLADMVDASWVKVESASRERAEKARTWLAETARGGDPCSAMTRRAYTALDEIERGVCEPVEVAEHVRVLVWLAGEGHRGAVSGVQVVHTALTDAGEGQGLTPAEADAQARSGLDVALGRPGVAKVVGAAAPGRGCDCPAAAPVIDDVWQAEPAEERAAPVPSRPATEPVPDEPPAAGDGDDGGPGEGRARLRDPQRVSGEHRSAPLDCLPDVVGDVVRTVSDSVQTAPELALAPPIAAASYATGGRVVVELPNGHHEPVGVWFCGTAAPSERKSAAMEAAGKKPLTAAFAGYWDGGGDEPGEPTRGQEQDALRRRAEMLDKRVSRLTSNASAQDGDEAEETMRRLDEAAIELDRVRAEIAPRPMFAVTDATAEGLESALANNGGVVASFADEAALLSTIAGRYAKDKGGGNLASLNQAWSQSRIDVVRASTSRTVREPHLPMCQLIQPDPFATVMGTLRQHADGFLSRWLYFAAAPYGPRSAEGPPIDADVMARWSKTLRALLERFWGQKVATVLRLGDDARALYVAAFNAIDTERRRVQNEDSTYAEWLGKAANGHTLRIAALFELMTDPAATEIGAPAMASAVRLYAWFADEARRAMKLTAGDTLLAADERELLGWIAKRRERDAAAGRTPQEWFQVRDVKRGPQRYRATDPAEIESLLTKLEDAGWLARADSAGRTDAAARWQVRRDFEQRYDEYRDSSAAAPGGEPADG